MRNGPCAGLMQLVAASLLSLSGCAGSPDSPREPYATLPPAAAPEQPRAFRVREAWDWTAALPARDPPGPLRPALAQGALGLFPAEPFRLATGACRDCIHTPAAALWWFRDELVAVPARTVPATSVTGGAAAGPFAPGLPPLPPLVWLGAPLLVEGAQLSADGSTLRAGGSALPFALPPPLPTNTAYLDASTLRFLAGRPLRVRGALAPAGDDPTFVGRTLWPHDARIDAAALEPAPLAQKEMLGTLIEAQRGAAETAFPSRLLFRSGPAAARDLGGRPALAFILSGAQGDDDGSRAGHVAVATGVFGPGGQWADWLVNNFYPAADQSEKGIVPGPVPADNYLFDVNSGQLYYRPGYMLVAVLRQPRVATAVQAALQRAMLDFHCRHFRFARARHNSTAMTIDAIRELGWRIPETGPTSMALAVIGAPIGALVGGGLDTGRQVYHALATEKTRMMPRVAFEVAGHDLLYLLRAGREAPGGLTTFEQMLVEDVEAVLFVRLPQVPSARRFGTYPVRSMLTYGIRVLTDPGEFESGPDTPTRELPQELVKSCGAAGATP